LRFRLPVDLAVLTAFPVSEELALPFPWPASGSNTLPVQMVLAINCHSQSFRLPVDLAVLTAFTVSEELALPFPWPASGSSTFLPVEWF
jgi:hypothetical protein